MHASPSTELPPLDRHALRVLNAISRTTGMAILRTLDGGASRSQLEISQAVSLSIEDLMPYLAALQDLGVIREKLGRFSLDTTALAGMFGQAHGGSQAQIPA
jgi:DNA-binding Lrp family transcriptional regulator